MLVPEAAQDIILVPCFRGTNMAITPRSIYSCSLALLLGILMTILTLNPLVCSGMSLLLSTYEVTTLVLGSILYEPLSCCLRLGFR